MMLEAVKAYIAQHTPGRTREDQRMMHVRVTRLANGLRVVSHRMPHLETVSLGRLGQGRQPP